MGWKLGLRSFGADGQGARSGATPDGTLVHFVHSYL